MDIRHRLFGGIEGVIAGQSAIGDGSDAFDVQRLSVGSGKAHQEALAVAVLRHVAVTDDVLSFGIDRVADAGGFFGCGIHENSHAGAEFVTGQSRHVFGCKLLCKLAHLSDQRIIHGLVAGQSGDLGDDVLDVLIRLDHRDSFLHRFNDADGIHGESSSLYVCTDAAGGDGGSTFRGNKLHMFEHHCAVILKDAEDLFA